MARNAYRGGERAAIRTEAKKVNAFLRLQRSLLDDLLGGAK